MKSTFTDARSTLVSLAQPQRAIALARFFKTGPGQYAEGDQFLGLSMPQQHTVVNQYANLSLAEVEKLVQDPIHECRMVGLLIWVKQSSKAIPSQQAIIRERYLVNRRFINNWDLVDVTCTYIIGRYAVKGDRSILYELASEDNLWSQRMAIVSTLALIRVEQFGDTFAIAEQLLPHKHDLIHKAVGWMLREVGKRNSDALEEFLHDHVSKMPRTALRYAIERFEPAKRAYYLKL
ncbi:DNA alkylation repair protein [Spirosoma radiotolerans]|uniref:DNA alkylation repair protein n=1 Tax=Spirosoma radiotolerans TaxID=1379870 RepID=A0A0E3V9K7_9BACT|nr:DNA alkylation repair protein [Spirosoma radiotolerans]AKD57231.1 DNA alkylation repair protein [Spirosoma radiotolerans]